MPDFTSHMPLALDEARAAALRGEVPVGAVITDPSGRIVASAGNRRSRGRNFPLRLRSAKTLPLALVSCLLCLPAGLPWSCLLCLLSVAS